MNRIAPVLAAALVSLLWHANAYALIDVSPKEITVSEAPMRVFVSNKGERPEYVSISLSRLLNPGVELAAEQLEPVSESSTPILYATPFRISLAPGQSKAITLRPLGTVDVEHVYRLDIRPAVGVLETGRDSATGLVAINVAYSALVRQLPRSEQASIAVACEAGAIRFVADGNVRYSVTGVDVDGETLKPFNVYPGSPRAVSGTRVKTPGQPACEITP